MAALTVALAGRPVAELTESADGVPRLRWRDDYRAQEEATPLSLSLPAGEAECFDGDRVAAWLRGLLPDDPGLIDHWVDIGVAAAPRPVALLASPIGRDCAGAVSFHPLGEAGLTAEETGETRWLSDAELAALLFELQLAERVGFEGFGGPDIAWFTLAGLHPKIAVVRCGDRWGIPAAPTPTTHILRLPRMKHEDRGVEHKGINEHLCLTAARNAGLDAVPSRILVFEDDETALAVERFDRVTGPDGAATRRHQEDLYGALGYPSNVRYQVRGGPSPAQVAGLLRARGGESEVWRFADVLAFTWLVAAPSVHTRRLAVLLDGPNVALAPLCGAASWLPYHPAAEQRPHGDFDGDVFLAMDIGGDHRLSRITAASWRRAARRLGLDAAQLVDRVAALAVRLPAAFDQAAQDVTVRAVAADFADRLCDLIARRAARLAALVDAPDGRGRPNRYPKE